MGGRYIMGGRGGGGSSGGAWSGGMGAAGMGLAGMRAVGMRAVGMGAAGMGAASMGAAGPLQLPNMGYVCCPVAVFNLCSVSKGGSEKCNKGVEDQRCHIRVLTMYISGEDIQPSGA